MNSQRSEVEKSSVTAWHARWKVVFLIFRSYHTHEAITWTIAIKFSVEKVIHSTFSMGGSSLKEYPIWKASHTAGKGSFRCVSWPLLQQTTLHHLVRLHHLSVVHKLLVSSVKKSVRVNRQVSSLHYRQDRATPAPSMCLSPPIVNFITCSQPTHFVRAQKIKLALESCSPGLLQTTNSTPTMDGILIRTPRVNGREKRDEEREGRLSGQRSRIKRVWSTSTSRVI